MAIGKGSFGLVSAFSALLVTGFEAGATSGGPGDSPSNSYRKAAENGFHHGYQGRPCAVSWPCGIRAAHHDWSILKKC